MWLRNCLHFLRALYGLSDGRPRQTSTETRLRLYGYRAGVVQLPCGLRSLCTEVLTGTYGFRKESIPRWCVDRATTLQFFLALSSQYIRKSSVYNITLLLRFADLQRSSKIIWQCQCIKKYAVLSLGMLSLTSPNFCLRT